MSSEHTISIATAKGDGHPDESVSIPIEELLTSNGLVTGQSDANGTESARLLAEFLLDAGETVLVVDPTGAFDALTGHASVLHVGGDRDCDVRVDATSVENVASFAIDGDASVVLDLSGFEADTATEVVGRLTDRLLETAPDRRTDFFLIVGECHRWLDAGGPATRSGENLVELGGRRHGGIGIAGVTDQPADLREDVLTGIDWLLAHRLTWREDVGAIERLLDGQYADALEDLADGEALFTAGWDRGVHRVRVDSSTGPRSTGATLDVERSPLSAGDRTGTRRATVERERSTGTDAESADLPPDAERSPDDDLLADVPEARSPDSDDAVASLRADLVGVEKRLAALEAAVDGREDVEVLVERVADAIAEGLADTAVVEPAERATENDAGSAREGTAGSVPEAAESPSNDGDGSADDGPGGFGDVFDAFGGSEDGTGSDPDTADGSGAGAGSADAATADAPATTDDESTVGTNGETTHGSGTRDSSEGHDQGGMSFEPIDFGFDEPSADVDSTVPDDFGGPSRRASSGRSIPRYLKTIVRNLEEMNVRARRMLAYYLEEGRNSPMDAHFSAGGGGDRTRAYAYNRQLRTNGLIEHVGQGQYEPRLREHVVDEAGHSVPDHELDRAVEAIHRTVADA